MATSLFAIDQPAFLAGLMRDSESYMMSRYDIFTLQSMFTLMQVATGSGLTNRAAYIGQLRTWFISVITYVAQIQTSINAATTDDELAEITWDFDAFNSTDPMITLAGAIAITN